MVFLLHFAFILKFIVNISCYLLTIQATFFKLENKIFTISTQFEAPVLHYHEN